MKFGLVRHFKVDAPPLQGWVNGRQFNEWVRLYDEADIRTEEWKQPAELWDHCLCSDLPRAVDTARSIYSGSITFTEQLREIEVAAVSVSGPRLPVPWWLALGRLSWIFGHRSQPESRRTTSQRVKAAVDLLESVPQRSGVLIVTHGAFMKQLERELRRRSYQGKRMGHPRNGQLYTYEKVEN
ncbi:histidine phosphatase family protein [Paenibacillus sp. FSL L8-0436]|uniref:histidine phosphatase family protein n=1 Tax=Paenibacillus sp. FSL L8-0436 TaxID=2954686 RepID=UPI0031597D5B